MFSAIKSLFSPAPNQMEAHKAYAAIVAQSRDPYFYTDCAVPDTVDGRFDMVVLHVSMVIQRLRREPTLEAGEFARVLQEAFFTDMDRSVREMGVSDTGVSKRIKAMAQAFLGRLNAYEQAAHNADALKDALKRNVYREADTTPAALSALVQYVLQKSDILKAQNARMIMQGEIHFS